MQVRIEAFARQLSEELGEPDDSNVLSWLDAIEERAIQIGNGVTTALVEKDASRRPVELEETTCFECGQLGQRQGDRERPLLTRRGKVAITEPECYCPCCRKTFFPMTVAIGVEVDCPFTSGMLRKVTYAGAQLASFSQGVKDLAALSEFTVSRERWSKRVGDKFVTQSKVDAAVYQQLELPKRRQSPREQVPAVACVQMDGGRIQIRDHQPAATEDESTSCWRETLVGCCLSMTSDQQEDPCPTIPATFVDSPQRSALSREIKGFSSEGVTRSTAATAFAKPAATKPPPKEYPAARGLLPSGRSIAG